MSDKYILKDKTPVKCDNLIEWAVWYEKADKHVGKTDLPGGIQISTVFLGLDHAFCGKEPLLFETMIFGGEHNEYQERYSTWEQAEAGHKRAVEMVFVA